MRGDTCHAGVCMLWSGQKNWIREQPVRIHQHALSIIDPCNASALTPEYLHVMNCVDMPVQISAICGRVAEECTHLCTRVDTIIAYALRNHRSSQFCCTGRHTVHKVSRSSICELCCSSTSTHSSAALQLSSSLQTASLLHADVQRHGH